MERLYVMRLQLFEPQTVGVIELDGDATFSYADEYRACAAALPLSESLPLRSEPYSQREFLPYFEGLLPEGEARAALASELKIPLSDSVSMLAACGCECIGDILISESGEKTVDGGYEEIDGPAFRKLFSSDASVAAQNSASRLSLAGTQTKTGLAHLPGSPMDEGWLKPKGYAATTHILKTSHLRDVPEIEFLCMTAAKSCGISSANVSLIESFNPVLAVERFDRVAQYDGNRLTVTRLHQEDLAQAFGIWPALKYNELESGSVKAIAAFLKARSLKPARDIAAFAQRLCFNYLVGNCDAHLKNYSLLSEPSTGTGNYVSLAPAYDFVCTTIFERFSREMAMELGGARLIDEATPDSLATLAGDLGITESALSRLIRQMPERIWTALEQAAKGKYGDVLESTPFIAEDLLADMAPRIKAVEDFCG